jgi:prepilin-type N-terminal cleavage/methylation domain-containing protein
LAATVRVLIPGSGSRERRRSSPAGFTLIELIVVVCIVALCAALLLDRLRFYQEAAEKAAVEYTVATVKSALQLRVAAMLVRGEERNIGVLARSNPIDWLMEPPAGYRGEFRAPQPAVPQGSWYFDATRNEIVYVPNLDAHLERLADGSKRLRFRVRLDFDPGDTDSERKRFAGMRIEPVAPYTWFYRQ